MPTATSASPAAAAASNYYGASPWMRALRLALGASQRAWPALAVRAAYRLFGTPLPLKWLNRRHGPAAGWQREAWAFEDADLGLYTPAAITLGAPRVLLVHGWGGHAGQMVPLAQALVAAGFAPLLLEMPAHGRSAGTVSNLPQFARAIEYVAARLALEGSPLRAVAAHSLGANALAYAASRGLRAERLVLLAPPASPHAFTRYFAHVFGLSERTRAAMQHRIEAREGILMPLLEPAAVGPRIAQPTLVVHDRDDRVNRFADGVAYRDAIAGARLLATEALGHRRILREPPVLEQVTAFIAAA
ncbi:alpha/beta hydrolase [Variovorax sp. JS1663]|uniref:alpha/beta hydrolase n=1 Tax=Variovorax sp. JS1663 TaxID=1851577 RepID=UPI000B342CC2|nr:alpha/beta fold hydrolase [Variovorax sp. JS1663]OUM01514.1 lysophospholipase [Variovorax sp. JS1663]